MADTITLELTQEELDAIIIALAGGPPRPHPGHDRRAAWKSVQDKITKATAS